LYRGMQRGIYFLVLLSQCYLSFFIHRAHRPRRPQVPANLKLGSANLGYRCEVVEPKGLSMMWR
jgi:hypothetical protein